MYDSCVKWFIYISILHIQHWTDKDQCWIAILFFCFFFFPTNSRLVSLSKLKCAFMRPSWYLSTQIIISTGVTGWAVFQSPSWAPCRRLCQSQRCASWSREMRAAGSSSIHFQVIKPKSGLIGKSSVIQKTSILDREVWPDREHEMAGSVCS